MRSKIFCQRDLSLHTWSLSCPDSEGRRYLSSCKDSWTARRVCSCSPSTPCRDWAGNSPAGSSCSPCSGCRSASPRCSRRTCSRTCQDEFNKFDGDSSQVLPGLRQAELLAVSPVGDLLHNLIVKPFQFPVENSLEGPGLVPALIHIAPETDLLEVVGSVPLGQVVSPPLGVPVQGEASLPVVVDGEGWTFSAWQKISFRTSPFLFLLSVENISTKWELWKGVSLPFPRHKETHSFVIPGVLEDNSRAVSRPVLRNCPVVFSNVKIPPSQVPAVRPVDFISGLLTRLVFCEVRWMKESKKYAANFDVNKTELLPSWSEK